MPKKIETRTCCVGRQRRRPRPTAPTGAQWIVVVVILAYTVLAVAGVDEELALTGLAAASMLGVRMAERCPLVGAPVAHRG